MKPRGRHLSWLLLFLAACGDDSPAPPVDSEAPVITAVSPAPWTRVSGTTTLAITAERARRYGYSIDNGTPIESDELPLSWNSADALNGPHRVTLAAINGVGSVDTTLFLVADNPGRGTAVLVEPREVDVEPEGEFQFEATILGGAGGGVSWHLVQPGPQAGAWGTLTEDGLYTAPDGLPVPPTATIVARSLADPGKSSSARLTIRGIAIRIVGAPAVLFPGESVQLGAQVQGSENQAVIFTLEDGPEFGSVTPAGFYTAPDVVPDPSIARIRATSQADPGRSTIVGIRILARPLPVTVSITPMQSRLLPNKTTRFVATVLNAVDSRVTWTVEGGVAWGTITPDGLYQAPAVVPAPPMARIRATSRENPEVSAVADVELRPPISVTVSPTSSSLFSFQTVTFTATLANADDPRVNWSIRGTAPVGTITSDGVYTAPAVLPPARSVTILAQSVEDPTVLGTAVVQLNPDSEIESIARLASVGYELAQISDQAVIAATGILALAQQLNGGQVTTTGRITKTDTSYQYEAIPEATTLEVVEPAAVTTLTISDFSGTPQHNSGGSGVSGSQFVGTLIARYQVGSIVDLRITHSSEALPGGEVAFTRFVRGTLQQPGFESFGVNDQGTAILGFHYEEVKHHVVGNFRMADGATGEVDETIELAIGDGCAFPPGTVSSEWHHRFRNSITIEGARLVSDGFIDGSVEGPCYGGGPRSIDAWGAAGTVTRNGNPWGEIGVASPGIEGALPDVQLNIAGVGIVRFRRAGVPTLQLFVPRP